MLFSAADQTAIIAAVGETVTIDSVDLTADVRLAGRLVNMNDGSIETTGPMIRVTAADYTANSIDHGTEVDVRGTTYTVVETLQEEGGLWALRLVKTAELITGDDNDTLLLDDGEVMPSL